MERWWAERLEATRRALPNHVDEKEPTYTDGDGENQQFTLEFDLATGAHDTPVAFEARYTSHDFGYTALGWWCANGRWAAAVALDSDSDLGAHAVEGGATGVSELAGALNDFVAMSLGLTERLPLSKPRLRTPRE